MRWAQQMGVRRDRDPIVIHLYSEFLQRFRLAAQGKAGGRAAPAPDRLRQRVQTYFDPLPFWYAPLESRHRHHAYPLNAVTQRPMAMYHSWDSQNAWLRQIHTHNYLHVNTNRAGRRHRRRRLDVGRVALGQGALHVPPQEAVEPGTVWTWNAIGKARGAWASARMPTNRRRASCSTT
jgi:anaerobic selenocysteine-containing dehydrogenase